ncbi:DUF2989 domain-containing protein [Thalassotalea atypica]|uniref:DUF2989 domain-containing protein n=1 Tax=Thalassotalea atypica TaxID=2054316 RepID=UPI00257418BF|nr:DUF2989 domain-containing protein [Thalassotalea atypica]
MKYIFPFLALLLFLSACDSGPDLAQLCSDNPDICEEFSEDNWCRQERKDTAFARFNLNQTGADKQKADLLLAYEDYANCMDHASKIEHIKLKHKKAVRVDNYLKAKEKINELSTQTINSLHPELLYYHWSRYLDKAALGKFLNLEGTAQLETPQSQYNLATYYVKKDLNKTLELLFHALELYKPEQKIDPEIFKTLTTIYTDKKEFKQAYVWLKILGLYAPEDETFSKSSLNQMAKGYQLNQEFLDRVAASTLEKIKTGSFVSPRR